MTKTKEPKKRGRKPGSLTCWWDKIDCPPEAKALYEMIGFLQHSDAFRTCHVYNGAIEKDTGRPMFKFEGRVHSMPTVFNSFLGLDNGRRTCNTPGCCNPFHYARLPSFKAPRPILKVPLPTAPPPAPPPAPADDHLELMDYYCEEKGIPCEFPILRDAIPPEDITDAQLHTAIALYRSLK